MKVATVAGGILFNDIAATVNGLLAAVYPYAASHLTGCQDVFIPDFAEGKVLELGSSQEVPVYESKAPRAAIPVAGSDLLGFPVLVLGTYVGFRLGDDGFVSLMREPSSIPIPRPGATAWIALTLVVNSQMDIAFQRCRFPVIGREYRDATPAEIAKLSQRSGETA